MGQSPASGSWKSGSLDAVGRQRSSSDPPNMHPPVPPIRLISTGGRGRRPPSPSSLSELFLSDFETDKQVIWCQRLRPRSGSCCRGKDGGLEYAVQVGPGRLQGRAAEISCWVRGCFLRFLLSSNVTHKAAPLLISCSVSDQANALRSQSDSAFIQRGADDAAVTLRSLQLPTLTFFCHFFF